jgi:hypothetical protein
MGRVTDEMVIEGMVKQANDFLERRKSNATEERREKIERLSEEVRLKNR